MATTNDTGIGPNNDNQNGLALAWDLLAEISADMDGQERSAAYLCTELLQGHDKRETWDLASLVGCLGSNIRESKAKVDAAIRQIQKNKTLGG